MVDYLLVAINSQYIHSNLAVRYLKAYGEKYSNKKIEIYESNINNQIYSILNDIYSKKAKVIIFSTYIWNREYVFKIIKEIKKIDLNVKIGLGGPDVSYENHQELLLNPDIDFIIKGQGERSFKKIINETIHDLKGVYENIMDENLDEIPFPYNKEDLETFNQIIYYESSRGCPFNCSYCLSSIDRGIKYFSMERVKRDLDIFLNSNIKLVKFVDRTFNLNKERYLEIWEYLFENYREGIVFHFEINANILDDESLNFLNKIPNDYFQFEIGIQSIKQDTMEEINRKNNISLLRNNIQKINKKIHMHLDLIAGLPCEGYEDFKESFEFVYNLKPDMIQLGFLKILKGTYMEKITEKHGYRYLDFAPYEVLLNKFISFDELNKLKGIEKILDLYYNSNKFKNTVQEIITKNYTRNFDFYEELMEYFQERSLLNIGHKTLTLFEILADFLKNKGIFTLKMENILKYDFLKMGKPGKYPNWFHSEKDSELYDLIIKERGYKTIREGHKNSEFEIFSYNIVLDKYEKVGIFFDYIKDVTELKKVDKNDEKMVII